MTALVVAGLLVAAFRSFLPKGNGGHGGDIAEAIWFREGKTPPLTTAATALTSIFAVGIGASIGREGSLKEAGAAIGSWFGEKVGLNTGSATAPGGLWCGRRSRRRIQRSVRRRHIRCRSPVASATNFDPSWIGNDFGTISTAARYAEVAARLLALNRQGRPLYAIDHTGRLVGEIKASAVAENNPSISVPIETAIAAELASEVPLLDSSMNAAEVVEKLRESQAERLPVIDHSSGKLIGTVANDRVLLAVGPNESVKRNSNWMRCVEQAGAQT